MKQILFLLLFLISASAVNAQVTTSFPTEKAKFLPALDQFMSAGKRDDCIAAFNDFQKLVKDGKITDEQLAQVIVVSNTMAGRVMAAYPYFLNYISAVNTAVNTGVTAGEFKEWNDVSVQVIQSQKKGDNSAYLKFVEFSADFFKDRSLMSSLAKSWKVDSKDYHLSFVDGKAKVSIPTTTLSGFLKGDTITVKQTAGDYYPLEKKWVGKSGRVDWGRAGLDGNKVYSTFKEYFINTDNFTYSVDTVTFYNPDFFPKPLVGKLTDKMVSSMDSNRISYPRFESYDQGITIKEIAPNVSYSGGFSFWGNKLIGSGTPDNKATLTFYTRDNKSKILSAKSEMLTIRKGEELGADKAEVTIYFGKDSIYHPQLNLVYKVQKREMRMLRGDAGIGKAKFVDSYHNHEFETDAIFWNLDSSRLNLKILSGVGKNPSIYESVNYFNKDIIRKVQGLASYEPLSALKRLYEKYGSRELNAGEFAKTLNQNLTEGETKTLLYQLVEMGFIFYNEGTGVIYVRDKTLNYVLANAKKIDYDVIRIKSAPMSGKNDYIDLNNSNIDLKGVKFVPISDTANVVFFPRNESISLQKDRNMQFDGMIYAGRMDLHGEKHKFQYAPFTVDLTKVDSMVINIPDGDKVDEYGQPILMPIRSKVEDMKGLLEIDAPINKSGRTRLPQFPRMATKDKSYVYYDDPAIAKGAYNRKSFYFELVPFKLDSLNSFSTNVINWKGTLVSGGIFPDIKDSIHIQEDLSLGFKTETPGGGYDLYKGKGKYIGNIKLDYSGLKGGGDITHSTSAFSSDTISFYPDSLRAVTDSFNIAKVMDGVRTPQVAGMNNMVFWRPQADSMHISMTDKTKPFSMYEGLTSMNGSLLLTGKGLYGSGTLDWDEATIASKGFNFRSDDMSADTAELKIKSISGDKVTFNTPNVSAKVDFKNHIGDFKSNLKNIPTEFAYNQYSTAINEFKWFMDEKILDFKAPPDGPGEYFMSKRSSQDGLKFLGKRATYNLITSILRIEKVPEIRVADASVVPDSGVVIIEAEAKMQQLTNAIIYADTTKRYHKIENAIVDIYGANELKAQGDYKYTTKDIKNEVIRFAEIGTKKEVIGEKKDKQEIYRLVAKGNIEEAQKFVIYPEVKYTGDVMLTSVTPLLTFKGFAKLDFKNTNAVTTNFGINQEVNPNDLMLKYDTVKNSDGNLVNVGILLSTGDVVAPYVNLMAPKQSGGDKMLFKSVGMVTKDAKTGDYVFGDTAKIKGGALTGNVLRYSDTKGTVAAEGKFDIGANLGIIRTASAGTADVDINKGYYKFNLTFGLDMKWDKTLQERIAFYMVNDNLDLNDINYDTDKFRKQLRELSDPKKDDKLIEEFEKTGVFKRPKELDHNFVFTDVNFVFDSTDMTLRSVGKLGLAYVGDKAIGKKLDGWIEVSYRNGQDLFAIYLKTGMSEWFYFEYRPGMLGVLSSYDDIISIIGNTDPDKRKVKDEKDRFYVYTIGNSMNKADFVDRMRERNGLQPLTPSEERQKPVKQPVDSLGGGTTPVDSGAVVPPQLKPTEKAPGGEGAEPVKEDNKMQQIQQEMEQMRQSGQPLLSGPPPGRDQPKQEEKPAEPATPVTPPAEQQAPPAAQPIETPAAQPPAEQQAPATETPAVQPPAEQQAPPVETPAAQPAAAPVETPVTPPAEQQVPPSAPPVETPAAQPPAEQQAPPAAQPIETPAAQPPAEQQAPPVETPAVQPPAAAPVETPVTPPAEQQAPPSAPPVETPASQPPVEQTPQQPPAEVPATPPAEQPTEPK
jgi:hypothetical protein